MDGDKIPKQRKGIFIGGCAAQGGVAIAQRMHRAFQQQIMHGCEQEIGGRLAGAAARREGLEAFIAVNRDGQLCIKRRTLAAGLFGKVAPIVFFVGVQGVPPDSAFLKHNPHRPARGQV